MNKIHKLVWSRTFERLVVVSEAKRGARGQKSTRRKLGALVAAVTMSAPLYADGELPAGGQVVAGAGSIETNGDAMTINQSTDRMIANWQSFSIGAGNSVTFNQPGADSVALNRVVGDSASQILGTLSANGQVFLVNPNGVLFGQGSQVSVGALAASTLDIEDADFLAANYRFHGEGGEIRNAGFLDGAVVALIAPIVTNEGTIEGSAALAAGTDVTLDFDGDGLLSVKVDAATLATLVENRGLIQTHGGTAILTARGASEALASGVNNSGVIQATSVTRQGGRILLDAIGGQTTVAGTLDASSVQQRGGRVVVTGGRVLLDDGARLAATGGAGGGEIYVGGSWQGDDPSIRQAVGTAVASGAVLDASATNAGDGGTVVAWSNIDDENSVTRAHGTFLARGGANGGDGGRIETSGHWLETSGVQGDAAAPQGQAGEWLFDPYNVTISAGASTSGGFSGGDPNIWTPSNTSTILNTDINSRLNAGTNVRITTGTSGAQIGDIYVNAAITKSGGADTTLTLRAANTIVVEQAITSSSGRLNVVLDADYNSADNTGDGAGVVMLAANIATNGGNLSFGSGRSATIGGVSTLVGGDVFVAGAGARTLTTGGGNFDVHGEMIIANTSGLSVTTGGGNVRFWGLLNSGNQYTYLDGPDGEANSWNYARLNARNGTPGGAAIGDSYLVTITSRLENSVAVASASYRGSWIGAYRPDFASRNWHWADGPEANVHFFTQDDPQSGAPTAGYYANYGSGEPNGCTTSSACETVGQFFGTDGQWNDLGANTAFSATQGSIYSVLGYVRETNIQNSPLVIDAGAGTVTFSAGVGGTKALASLDVSGGAVTVTNGARTSGTLAIDALTGNLAITGAIRSSDTTSSAIVLNAGHNAAAGTAAGGNILVGNGSTISVGAGGRATLFTGSVSGSTGLAALVGSGSGRFRYNSDETATNYTTALGTGAHAIFREQPTVAITANQTITYGQNPAPTWSASGLQNGDTNVQAISSGPSVAVDAGATTSSSGRYTAGTHTIDVSGSATGGLGYAYSISDGTLTVNAAAISAIAGITAQNRIYDGTTAATLDTGSATFTGMVAGDVLSVGSSTGTFLDRHAGNGKTVNITGLALAGADAANYTLSGTTASTTANVGQAALTVSTADVVRTYDGTVAANGTAVVTAGQLFVSDALSGGAFAFTDKNASAGDKTVTVANVAVNDGNGGANYNVTQASNTTSTINRAAIANITGIAAPDRVYDGTTAATLDNDSVTFTGMVVGDVLSVGAGTGAFLDKHAGTGKTVSITGLALAGTDAGNYTLTTSVASTTADITPASINAITGIAAQNRIYDGTTLATLDTGGASFAGRVAGDVLTVGTSSGAFVDKHVGSGKTVDITGLSLAGADAGNYTLASAIASTTANITPATITTITGIAAQDRIYDGTTAATLDTLGATFNGMIAGDALNVGAGNGAFLDKHVGSDKTVNVTALALAGADAGNYTLASAVASTTADITQATITAVSGIAAHSRSYDGTTAATLDTGSAIFNGLVVGDALNVGAGGGSFLDRHAGDGKTVNITGLALAGADAGNYTLANTTASTTADIGRAALTVSTADVVRTYDGTMSANGSAVITTGQLFVSDALSGGTFAFTDKNAGAGDKTVTVAGVSVNDGNGGNNYDVTLTANTTSTINRAVIADISGIAAQSRVYDGSTAAALDAGSATFNGLIAGDALSVGAGNGAFLDKHVGTGKTVSIAGLALAGVDAGNYTLASSTASASADITPATISAVAGIAAQDRIYDGTSAVTLETGGATFTGMIAGDALNVDGGNGAFLDKHVGTDKTVNITGIALAGADAGNYTLASAVANTTADITPATIGSITGIDAQSRSYDGTTAATLDVGRATFTGMIAGDVLSVGAGNGAFLDKHVGTGKTVNITGLALAGADAGNYTLASAIASSAADITPATISSVAGIAAQDRIYDATTTATLDTGSATFAGLIAGDVLIVGAGDAAFLDKHVGADKTVNITGISLAGADAANYVLASTAASATADITPATIGAITGITAQDRIYDGTTAATLTTGSATFTGMIAGDALNVGTGDGAFLDKHAGTDKTVTISGLALTGADAGNYTLASASASTTADITPATISAITGIAAQDRIYDGTTAAVLDMGSATFAGLVAGDVLTVDAGNGAFLDKHVGTDKTVNVTGLSLTGADAANYMLASSDSSATADITPAIISGIGGITAWSRAYDGTSIATLDTDGAVFDNVLDGDSLTVASAVGSFDNPDPGVDKNVSVTGLSLGGADAGNYLLAQATASTTADIGRPIELLPPTPALPADPAIPAPGTGSLIAPLTTSSTGSSGEHGTGNGIPVPTPAGGESAAAALAAKSDRNTQLTAMSVVEAPGSAVLVTFTLSVDGQLTVHVPDDVAAGGLGSEDDLRRLASEKLGVEASRILTIRVIGVARSSGAARA